MTIDLRDGVTVGVVDPRPTPVTATVLGSRGAAGPPGLGSVAYSMGPALVVQAGAYAWRAPQDCTVASVAAVVTTAPGSTPVVVDVLVGGVSLWADPGDRPAIAAGDTEAVAVPDTGALIEGDLLTVDVAAVDAIARRLVVVVHLTSPLGS
jgi:hypothetical protein